MKTHNKNGELSLYGLCCGYMERTESDNKTLSAELFHEHGLTHVRLFDCKAPNYGIKDFNKCLSGGRFWWSFESLTNARRLYRKLKTAVRRKTDYTELIVFEQGK